MGSSLDEEETIVNPPSLFPQSSSLWSTLSPSVSDVNSESIGQTTSVPGTPSVAHSGALSDRQTRSAAKSANAKSRSSKLKVG
jgi:hypothetical protein